jgi:hypothetical protein
MTGFFCTPAQATSLKALAAETIHVDSLANTGDVGPLLVTIDTVGVLVLPNGDVVENTPEAAWNGPTKGVHEHRLHCLSCGRGWIVFGEGTPDKLCRFCGNEGGVEVK